MRPAVVGRFERQPAPAKVVEPKRSVIQEPPVVPPAGPKSETTPPLRETVDPSAPTVADDTLPEDVVLRLLETQRSSFVRCFKKAVERQPMVISYKVPIHVELDADGAITKATADTSNAALSDCLLRATSWLQFPASGRVVVVDMPLFYRVE